MFLTIFWYLAMASIFALMLYVGIKKPTKKQNK